MFHVALWGEGEGCAILGVGFDNLDKSGRTRAHDAGRSRTADARARDIAGLLNLPRYVKRVLKPR